MKPTLTALIPRNAWLGCLLALMLVSAGHAETQQPALSFGVVPQQSAAKLAAMWTPLLEHLTARTGQRLQFRTAPNIPEFERRLASGDYDIAYMNPYHYTVFHRSPGYRAFAKQREKKLVGIIVVRTDSGLSKLEELGGQTLAFPSPAAFAASILTRAEFNNRDIAITPKYVSSHDSVYLSVVKGLYPAGGGVVGTLNNVDPAIREQLHILWTSAAHTPHAFAAHPRVPQRTIDAIAAEMLKLDGSETGRQLLQRLNFKGIAAADDAEWNSIRELKLDLLDNLVEETAEARQDHRGP
jgi:phosphonate transport system substrate-binding protein